MINDCHYIKAYCQFSCFSYGPREAKFRDEFSLVGQITCELKFATFSRAKRGQHQQTTAEKEASMIVKEALAPAVQLVCKQCIWFFLARNLYHKFLVIKFVHCKNEAKAAANMCAHSCSVAISRVFKVILV